MCAWFQTKFQKLHRRLSSNPVHPKQWACAERRKRGSTGETTYVQNLPQALQGNTNYPGGFRVQPGIINRFSANCTLASFATIWPPWKPKTENHTICIICTSNQNSLDPRLHSIIGKCAKKFFISHVGSAKRTQPEVKTGDKPQTPTVSRVVAIVQADRQNLDLREQGNRPSVSAEPGLSIVRVCWNHSRTATRH